MKYGILGTGDVAHVIATKLTELGHEVMMGHVMLPTRKLQTGQKLMESGLLTALLPMLPDSVIEYSTVCRASTRSKLLTLPGKEI